MSSQASLPHHRVALSYQNSPLITPKHGSNQAIGGASNNKNKSPFMSKDSRKNLSLKEANSNKGGIATKGHTPNTTTAKRVKNGGGSNSEFK